MTTPAYLIPISESIKAAWSRVHGSKGTFWAAIGITILIAIGLQILSAIAKAMSPAFGGLISFISQIILTLLEMGILYIGIQRAFDLPITYKQMWRAFDWDILIRLIGFYLLQMLMFLPVILLIAIPMILKEQETVNDSVKIIAAICYLIAFLYGIFIFTRLLLGWGFILDKGVGPIQAIKLSWSATRSNFLRLFLLVIINSLIFILSVVLLLVGIIWTLPFGMILYGIMYKSLIVNSQ